MSLLPELAGGYRSPPGGRLMSGDMDRLVLVSKLTGEYGQPLQVLLRG